MLNPSYIIDMEELCLTPSFDKGKSLQGSPHGHLGTSSITDTYPVSLIFIATLKIGDEIGLLGQTRAEKQGDFKDNCNVQEGLLFYLTLELS